MRKINITEITGWISYSPDGIGQEALDDGFDVGQF
jgi:hypothetical protein